MNNTTDYRYPGSRPFQDLDLDRLLFWGREREKQSLLHLVLAENLVVLFAKSGMGKTSLINAGLLQPLREKDFLPIQVRFNRPENTPIQSIYAAIKNTCEQNKYEYIPGEENTLWQYFKTVEFWFKDVLFTPVLILDQFEEFFTLNPKENRKAFITQLSNLVKGRMPQALRISSVTKERLQYTETPPHIKVIIAIREDFLGQLEEMANEIPEILLNRFRLSALKIVQAKQAIKEPARRADEQITAKRFKYAPETVEAMLDFLRKRKEGNRLIDTDEVEPFQLQLLCQHIEKSIHKKQSEQDADIVVQVHDLGGPEGMDKVLQGFYADQINQLKLWYEKRRVRKLCEKGLISITDRRLSLEEEQIDRKYKVPKELLAKLVDSRLLRADPRVGSVYYELSHDTLVKPIRISQSKRIAKRNSKVAISTTVLIIALLVFGIVNFNQPKEINIISSLHKEARELALAYEPDKAIEKYREILEIEKKDAEAYVELGRLFASKREYAAAIENYQTAIENDVKTPSIYYQLGKALESKGSFEAAIKNYQKATEQADELNPRLSSQAFIGLGDIYAKQKNYDQADMNYKVALKLNPKSAGAYKQLGILYIERGEPERAIEVYKRAVEKSPENAYIYTSLANRFKEKNLSEQLAELYHIASKVDLKDASYYSNLAYSLQEQNKHEEAIESYKKTIEIDPKHVDAYINTGNSLRSLCRYGEARERFEKAIEINPKEGSAYYNLGAVLEDQGRYEEAIERFEKAIEIDPKMADAYNGLGVALTRLGRYEEAIERFEKAIEIDPKMADAYNGLGVSLSRLGRYEEARERFEKAIEIDPNDQLLKLNLAEANLITDHFNQALKSANESLKDKDLRTDRKLGIWLVSISSLLFQEKRSEAYAELRSLFKFYKSLTQEYYRKWSYVEIKNFITGNETLPKADKNFILKIIDILESPKSEADKKIQKLEATLPQIGMN